MKKLWESDEKDLGKSWESSADLNIPYVCIQTDNQTPNQPSEYKAIQISFVVLGGQGDTEVWRKCLKPDLSAMFLKEFDDSAYFSWSYSLNATLWV